MPTGIPTAPMQSPSKSTELRNCFDVAPTEERIPICRMRSFREMLNELYIRNMEPTMIIAVTITPAEYSSALNTRSDGLSDSPITRSTLWFRMYAWPSPALSAYEWICRGFRSDTNTLSSAPCMLSSFLVIKVYPGDESSSKTGVLQTPTTVYSFSTWGANISVPAL